MLNIKTNIDKFIRTELKHYNKAVKDATWSATNKVAKQAKTQASKDIREEYAIKKSDLDKNIIVTKPDLNYVAKISTKKGSLPLAKFGRPSQKKTGVSVEIKRGQKKIIKGSFIAVMKSGHKGVFERAELGGKKVARLPIKELHSKAAAHIVTKAVYEKMKLFVATKFPQILAQELKYRLNK